MKLIKRLKKSIFAESLARIKKNKKKTLCILLFDLLFVAAVYAFTTILKSVIPANPEFYLSVFKSAGSFLTFVALFYVVYVLVLIFIYTFFKYHVLYYVKSIIEKTRFNYKSLWKFFALNVLLFVILFVLFVIIALIHSYWVREAAKPYFAKVVIILFLLFSYVVVNTAHSMFAWQKKKKIMNTVKKMFGIIFTKPKNYFWQLVFAVAVFAVFSAIVFLTGFFIDYIILGGKGATKEFAMAYNAVLMIITAIMIYCVAFANRVYFYLSVNK